jgi:hypothetical protein
MGIAPDDAVMVGDHRNDLLAARGAGVAAIFATFGYGEEDHRAFGAAAAIDRFGDLPGKPAAIGATWRAESRDARELGLTRELKLAKADAATFESAIASSAEAPKADAAEEGVVVVVNKKAPKAKDAVIRGACRASRTDGFVLAAEETITATLEGAGPDGQGTVSLSLRRSLQRTTAAAADPLPASRSAAPRGAAPSGPSSSRR